MSQLDGLQLRRATLSGAVRALLLSASLTIFLAELYRLLQLQISGPPWITIAGTHSLLSAMILAGYWRHRRTKLKSLWLLKNWYWYVPSLLILVGACVLVLGSHFLVPSQTQPSVAPPPLAWILWIPLVEEVVFRLGVGGIIRRCAGANWLGVWFSALCFAWIHTEPTLANLASGHWGLPLGPFMLGLADAVLLLYSGTLWPAITLHAACNATAMIFALGDARWLNWLAFLYA